MGLRQPGTGRHKAGQGEDGLKGELHFDWNTQGIVLNGSYSVKKPAFIYPPSRQNDIYMKAQ
jgi:hypothetical protein